MISIISTDSQHWLSARQNSMGEYEPVNMENVINWMRSKGVNVIIDPDGINTIATGRSNRRSSQLMTCSTCKEDRRLLHFAIVPNADGTPGSRRRKKICDLCEAKEGLVRCTRCKKHKQDNAFDVGPGGNRRRICARCIDTGEVLTRSCATCKVEREPEAFRQARGKGGQRGLTCIPCDSQRRVKAQREKRRNSIKGCRKCLETKPRTEYRIHPSGRVCLDCLDCEAKHRDPATTVVCKECRHVKVPTDMAKHRTKKRVEGYRTVCKSCMSKRVMRSQQKRRVGIAERELG